MRAVKVQASLRIRTVSPEPSLLAHTSSESRETFRQKARSLASLNGWACAVKICHDGMLEDTNSLDGALLMCSCILVTCGIMIAIFCCVILFILIDEILFILIDEVICQKVRKQFCTSMTSDNHFLLVI